MLSKSRFQSGLQCLKRLYLECYHRELADPVGAAQQAIFDRGVAVGELARRRFPGGILVEETHFEHDRAVETTKSLLTQVEVKSTTRVKPEHISDVAIQVYVVEGSGVPVSRAYLMHLNRGYAHQSGNPDLERQFSLQDVTDAARSFVAERAPEELTRMRAVLRKRDTPDIKTGPHCSIPYRCSFYGYCHGRSAGSEI